MAPSFGEPDRLTIAWLLFFFFFDKLEYFTQRERENMDGDGTGWITHKSCCRTHSQLTQARLVVQASYLQISFEGLARWADLFLV